MNQLAVVVIVVLFPGILAATVADKLTVHSKWDSFKFALYSFLLGVLTYSVLQILAYAATLPAFSSMRTRRHLCGDICRFGV
ncbi:MAG TPA: hypothetical protein VE907_19625 [Gammaproteobacteria bacterium]|nr:hypothetical protein [Gammaproteobacteria bacterium]